MPAFLKDHLALLVSASGALYVAIRLYLISGGSSETYSIILQTQGTGSVLVSALLELIPTLPVYFACYWLAWSFWANGRMVKLDWLWVISAIVLALMFTPFMMVALVLLVIGVVAVVSLVQLRGRARKKVQEEAAEIRDKEDGIENLPTSTQEAAVERDWEAEWAELGEDEIRAKKAAINEAERFADRLRMEVEEMLEVFETPAPKKFLVMVPRIDSLIVEADRQMIHPELVEAATTQIGLLRKVRGVAERAEKAVREAYPRFVLISVSGLALSVAISAVMASPWIPLERVETSEESVVGYVLEEQPDQVTILRDSPRDVRRIGPVTERTYCVSAAVGPDGVVDFLLRPLLMPIRRGSYPEC